MKRKKQTIKVSYEFIIEYEFEEHLEQIKKDLRKRFIYSMSGAGETKDNNFGGYSCRVKENSGTICKK